MAEAGRGGSETQARIVGRYEILREIGRGGMAVVYVARQPDLDRQVALKELGAFHAGSAEFAHRFLRESRLAGSLNHPNIVTVHEYFEHDGTPYIAMEYVRRGSLRPYMKRLSLAQIGGVLEGVLAGLAHAETAGIVHRDLKPENIMVTSDGRVKITDFGIARATERAGTQYMTATGMTVGTPTYMAPEQAMAGDIGPWTDLYSIGVLSYELVVGQVPFHGTEAPLVMLMRHVNERIPPPIEVRPEVDPRLSSWVDALLVKDPLERTRHAGAAWESFEDIIVGLLGPLWRRDARLLDDQVAAESSQPLTPAPFASRPMRTPTPPATTVPEEFVTFDPQTPEAPGVAPAAEPALEVAAADAAAATPAGEVAAPDVETPVAPPAVDAESPAPHVTQFVTFGAAGAGIAGAAAAAGAAGGEVAVPSEVAYVATPVGDPRVDKPPAVEPPVAEPPIAEPPVAEPPVAEPPVAEPAEPEREFVTYGRAAAPAPPEAVAEPAVEPERITEPVAESAVEPEPVAEAEPELVSATEPELTLAPEAVTEAEPIAEADRIGAAEPELTLAPAAVPESEPVAQAEPALAAAPAAERDTAVTPRRIRKRPIAILAAGVAVAAAAIGFLVAPTSKSGSSSPPKLTQSAQAGPLKISYPAGWHQLPSASTPAEARSLQLANAVTLSPGTSASDGALVVGTAKNDGASLLPAGLTAKLQTVPPDQPVKLGSTFFERYFDLKPQGASAPESIYARPTTFGTATAVCVEPQSNQGPFGADCERSIGTLAPTTGAFLPLGADPAFARGLNTMVAQLDSAIATWGHRLDDARNRRGQAAAAVQLSDVHNRAAGQIAKLTPGPATETAAKSIIASLKAVGTAYGSLATAAANNKPKAYATATAALSRDESTLHAAFMRLQQAGYTVAPRASASASGATGNDAVGALDSFWNDVRAGNYLLAYTYYAPGAIHQTQAQFVASERQAGISSVEFQGRLGTSSGTSATVDVVRLMTTDHQSGCRTWSGNYKMVFAGGGWLIQQGNLRPQACAR